MSEYQTPLTAPMFHVLLALADGDKHGYAILKEVAEQTNDEVQLNTGTLYGIIKRLLIGGLISEVRKPAVKKRRSATPVLSFDGFRARVGDSRSKAPRKTCSPSPQQAPDPRSGKLMV